MAGGSCRAAEQAHEAAGHGRGNWLDDGAQNEVAEQALEIFGDGLAAVHQRIGQGLAHLIGGLLPLLTNLILSLDAGLGHGFFIECLQDRFRVRLIRLRAGLNALTLQVTQGHGLGALDVCHLERAGLELDLFKHLARGLDAGLVLEKRVFVGLDGSINAGGVLLGNLDQLLLDVLCELLRLGELLNGGAIFAQTDAALLEASEQDVQVLEVVGIDSRVLGVEFVQ